MNYDVVVVGAGPVGSTAARFAAMNGASVLLLEEHASIGAPVECTGLLSTRAVSECGINPSDEFVLNDVSGVFIYSPNGGCLPIDGGKTKAYAVSRKMFDRRLAAMATEAGVDILLRTKAIGLETGPTVQKLEVLHKGLRKTITSSVVIGADGVQGKISKMAGLGNVEKVLSGIQVEAPYASKDDDFVELFLGSPAPGFFAWTVPLNDRISRIGLAVPAGAETPSVEYLNSLLNSNPHVSKRYGGGSLDLVIGGIPLGPLKRTVSEGVMIVGDAAGQVKPTSGGGVYTGAVCAKIAGEVAAFAANEGDASSIRLNEYETRWHERLGRELGIGMKIHEYIGGLKDAELDDLLTSMNTPGILNMITEYGDMDQPSVLIKKLLSPTNSLRMLKVFRTFARTVL